MATVCSNCLNGMCREHPLQDHGARAKDLKLKSQSISKSSLKTNVIALIRNQIEKLESESKGTDYHDKDNETYRLELEKQRERIAVENSKKKRKHLSNEEITLDKSGLNPFVIASMKESDEYEDSDDNSDSDIDTEFNPMSSKDVTNSSSRIGNVNDSSDNRKSKKHKKEKKMKKDKKKHKQKDKKSR